MTVPSQAGIVPRRRIGGLGVVAMFLIGVVVVLTIVSAWSMWHAYGVVTDYIAELPGVTDADLVDADDTVSTVSWLFLLGYVAAAVVFIVWLWWARLNAEEISPAYHRRSRGWIIGSWICPVVNLWFPFMIVDDVYRASRPTNSPDLMDLRSVPESPVVGTWWGLWLGGLLLNRIAVTTWNNAALPETLRTGAVIQAIQCAAVAASAVAIIMVMRQIIAWQDGRAAR